MNTSAPTSPASESAERGGRRSFLGALIAIGTASMAALLSVPLAKLALFPLRRRGGQEGWSDLGPLESFARLDHPIARQVTIEQPDGWERAITQQMVYVIPDMRGQPKVVSAVCPHLGCSVQWRPEQQRFVCPCHGGTFALDGHRLAGPPARDMDSLPHRIQDGHLYCRFVFYRQLLASQEAVD